MAQVARVIQGDPAAVASQLNTLAATESIKIVEKTFSAGDYIVVSDNAAGTGQTVVVLKGDPAAVAAAMPATVNVVCPTFSASQYIVVRT
jgi:hypothetical protein